jgi:hypothetical protein
MTTDTKRNNASIYNLNTSGGDTPRGTDSTQQNTPRQTTSLAISSLHSASHQLVSTKMGI